jgi:hypothetical protein
MVMNLFEQTEPISHRADLDNSTRGGMGSTGTSLAIKRSSKKAKIRSEKADGAKCGFLAEKADFQGTPQIVRRGFAIRLCCTGFKMNVLFSFNESSPNHGPQSHRNESER